ncbi:hypothetical protein [Psychromonas sp. SP041]|uniref:hypothetical protein n=1 Tax=Psychromonas sp. SP041 TaxID=1365007 RepID=UPI0004268FC2|nr:hypothetical protein [Psychromonas sp. SP041]
MKINTTEIDWSECIVIFNSLIRSIEYLRVYVESDDIDEDDAYDAEEELNDYIVVLTRLRKQYSEIEDKGELSESLKSKLMAIC